MRKTTCPPSQNNSHKLDNAQISLDFLQKEVSKLSKEQKEIRLMLLEILEQTRPYHLTEKPTEPIVEEPPPVKSSWFWN
mgnify:CR=1 FL=1|tara:strand:- start:142 stop:378 length:237 start_codon:yes stop_codon:yes gene_type:complete